jgi:uncharacterized protein YndB with AHSA1/START domain
MTTENTILEITRVFDTSPARLFNAWIQREEWQSWIGPDGMNCEVPLLEPRVDGHYRVIMKMSDGKAIPVGGVFRAIEPNTRLAFTWGLEGDEARQSLITITIRDLNGKAELTLRQEGLGSAENRDAHGKGWNSAFNKLAIHISA